MNIGYDPLTVAGLVAVVCIVIAFLVFVAVARYAARVDRESVVLLVGLEELAEPRSGPVDAATQALLRVDYASTLAKAFKVESRR